MTTELVIRIISLALRIAAPLKLDADDLKRLGVRGNYEEETK